MVAKENVAFITGAYHAVLLLEKYRLVKNKGGIYQLQQ